MSAHRIPRRIKSQFRHFLFTKKSITTQTKLTAFNIHRFALVNHYQSCFNDVAVRYVSGQVHEIGHNLGLTHSDHGAQPYGDQSGYMGFGYAQDEGPTMCFNAAKSWWTTWYQAKTQEIPFAAGVTFLGYLAPFVDYMTTDKNVLYKIGDYYLIFNKAKGMNAGTGEFPNQVTATYAVSLTGNSNSVGGVAVGGPAMNLPVLGMFLEFCSLDAVTDEAFIALYPNTTASICSSGAVAPHTPYTAVPTTMPPAAMATALGVVTGPGEEEFAIAGADEKIKCVMYTMATAGDSSTEMSEVCETADNRILEVPNLPEKLLAELDLEQNSGSVDLTFTHAGVTSSEVALSSVSDIEIGFEDGPLSGQRKLQTAVPTKINGVKKIVALRVIDSRGVGPTDDVATISDKLFGTGGDVYNLKSRYQECSFGKMVFEPVEGDGFVGGVAEVHVDVSSEGAERVAFMNAVLTAATQAFGALNPKYDHVAFVFPAGTVKTSGGTWHA